MKKNKGNTKKKKNIRNKYSKLRRMRNDRDVWYMKGILKQPEVHTINDQDVYLKDSTDKTTSLILLQSTKHDKICLTDLNDNPSIKPNLNNVGNDLDDFSILTNTNDNSLNTPKSGDHK